MTKHTNGKWEVRIKDLMQGHYGDCAVFEGDTMIAKDLTPELAKQIVKDHNTAPELLEELEDIVTDHNNGHSLHSAIRHAKKTISNARGK